MQTIEIIGALIGLVYLYLEYKANKWLWPVGVLMPVVYTYIFFQSKFYADMGINIYYFFASIYGWIMWTRRKKSDTEQLISHTPSRFVLPLLVAGVALFSVIAFVLIRYTDSPIPYGDSFTTTVSILAMWMLAHKYIEQWWLWIAVNVVSCGLYIWKGMHIATILLFVVYSIVPFFGYVEWKRLMKKEKHESSN